MRFGNLSPSDSNYFNKEVGINELRNELQKINIVGAASNRQVTLNSSAAVEITPGTNKRIMHIFNNTGVGVRYGGSGVTTSTGGKIFSAGSLALAVDSDSSIYLIPESGGDVSIDIVEFD